MAIGPAPRNDKAYIMQLALQLQDLERRSTALISRISANYPTNTPGEIIIADTTSGAVTVSLPFAKEFYGKSVFVKKIDASVNAVTLQPQSGDTIDGASNKAIAVQYMSYTVFSTGAEWIIV
ncbi:hypothetical protein [Agrobacterium tumefaciens]|uniref:Uncharacterized protein n=1 Tax=Agrobacterium tumefaciens TaxID=358 RepID=A0A176WY84_AGRTU|nr:hypothetical protein [Agrobacterium tumefaciens]OAE37641.1 hypothetical protein A7J57_08670 [Agrobacterium tumefaciens]